MERDPISLPMVMSLQGDGRGPSSMEQDTKHFQMEIFWMAAGRMGSSTGSSFSHFLTGRDIRQDLWRDLAREAGTRLSQCLIIQKCFNLELNIFSLEL